MSLTEKLEEIMIELYVDYGLRVDDTDMTKVSVFCNRCQTSFLPQGTSVGRLLAAILRHERDH